MNLAAVHQSMKFYKDAMQEYTVAMESAPHDHRLYSNRALCYLAVEEWAKGRDDAAYCARLRPDFKKAWLLLTKACWKMGQMDEARNQLQQGLRYLPGCADLLELQADFSREVGEQSFGRMASRSVSPVYTPPPSRNPTPPRAGQSYAPSSAAAPGNRPVSPRLVAAGEFAAQSRAAAAQTYGGPTSRSPGPGGRHQPAPPPRPNMDLNASDTFQTGNFGAPTPVFAAGGGKPPPNEAMAASFPAHAHSMWANAQQGNAGNRSAYSPGPSGQSAAAQTMSPGTARTSSHSPGPAFRPPPPPPPTGGAPDFGASTRADSTSSRKKSTSSLRGLLESSTKSRGNTPPSRGPTPPRR